MRAFAAVFAREVRERRILFLVGLVSGLLCLVASALHRWNAPGNAEVRLLAGSVGGLALGAALALAYGASTIAGETAEKRISFYFSRPISDVAIWGGKLLAAVFVSFGAGLLVFLPGALTGPAHASSVWGFDVTVVSSMAVGLAAVVGCVLVAHAFTTVARLRSPWAFFDLAFAAAFVWAALVIVRSLMRDRMLGDPTYDSGPAPAGVAIAALSLTVVLALVSSTLAQIAVGRADARRAHGAFSLVLWGVLGSGVLAAGAFAGWCASAKAGDITRVAGSVSAAHRGPWIAVGGALNGPRGGASFLFDPAKRTSIRLRGYGETFSTDGTRAVWGEPEFGILDRKSNRTELVMADLASGRAVETGVVTADWAWLALSPSGRRLAALDGGALNAYDVSEPANPKLLATFRILRSTPRIAFVDEDTIRLFPRFFGAVSPNVAAADLEITELSLPSKKSTVTGRVDPRGHANLRLSADGRLLLGVRREREDASGPHTLVLLDGRTGAVVATLAEGLRNVQARFLSGNGLVVAGLADARARALFFEGEKGWSAPARSVDLGPAARLALGGEIAHGRVAVSLITFEENLPAARRAAKLALVDAGSGAISFVEDSLVPVNRFGWWLDPVMTPAEPGAPWTSLFIDADGRLVRLDPATGARTVLLGKGK